MSTRKSTVLKDPIDSLVAHVGKLADNLPEVFLGITQSHPVVMALIMMGFSRIMFVIDDKHSENWNVLYLGSQMLGAASATAPVIAGGLQILGQYLATRGGISK